MSEEVSNVFRATFDESGFPTGFYPSEFWPDGYPETAVEITEAQYDELRSNQGQRRFVGGEVVEYLPPVVETPEPATVVYAVDLWTRLDGGEDGNSGEVAQVIAEMEQQPIRIRKIFDSATSYRSDHELWPLLQQIATTLFGEERAAQILAPSSQ